MVAPYKRTQSPRPYYRHAVFGDSLLVQEATQELNSPGETQTNSLGLGSPYWTYPEASQEYAVIALDYLGLPKDRNPSPFGTIAEMVVFGMLLDGGFYHYIGDEPSNGSFVFQSYELGGRQPGGAVVDFVVFHGNSEIAIRVQSIFHSPKSPFGNGAGELRELEQRNRLLTAGFERVVGVNEPPSFVIENGPNEAVRQEYSRILGHIA